MGTGAIGKSLHPHRLGAMHAAEILTARLDAMADDRLDHVYTSTILTPSDPQHAPDIDTCRTSTRHAAERRPMTIGAATLRAAAVRT